VRDEVLIECEAQVLSLPELGLIVMSGNAGMEIRACKLSAISQFR